ncbi:monovalent cation/H+ antiporter complex subunit F [Aliidiomarina haloalkalitolerans]|nr:monovalent cation/H+ antiporter complex subunit F [Aliidiomarina haloalkalitolerans]
MSFHGVIISAAIVLLFSLLAGLWRIWRGPESADRMLAAQLFGTTGVALVVLLAVAMPDVAGVLDVALVLALLAAVAMIAFVRRFNSPHSSPVPSGENQSHSSYGPQCEQAKSEEHKHDAP